MTKADSGRFGHWPGCTESYDQTRPKPKIDEHPPGEGLYADGIDPGKNALRSHLARGVQTDSVKNALRSHLARGVQT